MSVGAGLLELAGLFPHPSNVILP
eukprot:SAG31_NODE_31989_length_361_cov_1.068702_1_plen_23_part_10